MSSSQQDKQSNKYSLRLRKPIPNLQESSDSYQRVGPKKRNTSKKRFKKQTKKKQLSSPNCSSKLQSNMLSQPISLQNLIDSNEEFSVSELQKIQFLSDEMLICYFIHLKILNHKYGFIFAYPVDPVLLGISEYFDQIEEPIDLQTIKIKLLGRIYQNRQHFQSDIELMFRNSLHFNKFNEEIFKPTALLDRYYQQIKNQSYIEKVNQVKQSILSSKRAIKVYQQKMKKVNLHKYLKDHENYKHEDYEKVQSDDYRISIYSNKLNQLPLKYKKQVFEFFKKNNFKTENTGMAQTFLLQNLSKIAMEDLGEMINDFEQQVQRDELEGYSRRKAIEKQQQKQQNGYHSQDSFQIQQDS